MKSNNMIKIFLFLMIVSLSIIGVNALDLGQNYENECINDVCTTTIYSYQKNYYSEGQWHIIDESFGTDNCAPGYDYCVDQNVYQFNVKDFDGTSNHAFYTIDGQGFVINFKATSLGDISSTSVEVNDNNAKYAEILPGIDLDYYYLPHKLKEVITIKNKPSGTITDATFTFEVKDGPYMFAEEQETDNLLISKNGKTIAEITDLIAYDAEDSWIPLSSSFDTETTNFVLSVDQSWLMDEERVYPVYIDPTVRFNTTADGNYIYDTAVAPGFEYGRDFDSFINCGVGRRATIGGVNEKWRCEMDFNLNVMPTDAIINTTTLHVYVTRPGNDGNDVWGFGDMGNPNKNVTQVSDNNDNNKMMWEETGEDNMTFNSGFSYRMQTMATGYKTVNLTNASDSIGESILNNLGSWGFSISSLRGEGGTGSSQNHGLVASSEHTNPAKRPFLNITYHRGNTTLEGEDGDDAIEQGIINVITDPIIYSDQQVNIRLTNGTQELGRFDKVAANATQRWAFNYITHGEEFTNMNNITASFFVLEMTDLISSVITQTVEDFIAFTKK
jgi:hypothetical protein